MANSSLSSYYTCVMVRSYRVSLQMSCASMSGWVIPLNPGLSGRNVPLSVSSCPLSVEPVLWGTCGLGVVAPAGPSLLVLLDFFILLDSVDAGGAPSTPGCLKFSEIPQHQSVHLNTSKFCIIHDSSRTKSQHFCLHSFEQLSPGMIFNRVNVTLHL